MSSDGAATSDRPHAFRVVGLSKSYRIYARPLDRILELFFGGIRHREFEALKDFSIVIPRGTALGVVGDNGAGKSTLLHLLAGSHQPSSGRIDRHGTVLGLLELGVGFHPEFSGRDNVFFYGDMLGLDRRFVSDRFEEIVEFAELEAFIDQPLRTYSTGMKMRLAFSLVASLDPDILIVDEALAVGDMHFQKKCIERMLEFKERGKTIILCSHSTYQIATFCDEVIWIKNGRLHRYGRPEEVLPEYEAYQMRKSRAGEGSAKPAPCNRPARIVRFGLASEVPVVTGEDFVVEWQIDAQDATAYHVTISLKMDSGRGIFVTGSQLRDEPPFSGGCTVRLTYPEVQLLGGLYCLHLRLWDDTGLVLWDEAVVDDIPVRKVGREMGVVRMTARWQVDSKLAAREPCA